MPLVKEATTFEFGEAHGVIDPQIPAPTSAAISAQLPERIGWRRKMAYLFADDSGAYVRVNFQRDLTIDSYWVFVSNGQLVSVTPEANQPFKPDSK